jgi:chromosome segregation ATPase
VQKERKMTQELPEEGGTAEVLETKNEDVEQLRGELQKMEQNLKSAQGVTKKQSQELEELRGKLNEAVSSRDTYQALIGLVSQQTGRSEEDIETEVQAKKPDLKKVADELVARQELKRKQAEFKTKFDSYGPKVQELGLKPEDKAFKRILALASVGDWESADEEIEALKAKPQEPVKETGETEDERVNRLAEEKLKKTLIEKGLLTPEGGEPSASPPKGFAKIEQGYIDGKVSRKEYDQARREAGID